MNAPLEYEQPRSAPMPILWAFWLCAYSSLCGLLCVFSFIGIRLIQRRLGTTMIWKPSTGTDFYDDLLIDLPMRGMFWLAVIWSGVGIYWLFGSRRQNTLLLLITIWPVFFALEWCMNSLLWESVLP